MSMSRHIARIVLGISIAGAMIDVCNAQGTAGEEDQRIQFMDLDIEQLGNAAQDLQDVRLTDKINLSEPDVSQWLRLLDPDEVALILKHTLKFGPLENEWELQAVQGLSNARIRELRPYVLFKGRSEPDAKQTEVLFLTSLKTLSSKNAGHSIRIRGISDEGHGFHLTLKQDPMEPFVLKDDQVGYDFISAGLDVYLSKAMNARLLIGDFRASFGQGLTLGQGFGIRKSVDLNMMAMGNDRLYLHRSTSESSFFRGVGLQNRFFGSDFTIIGSIRHEDATIHTDRMTGEEYFRSFSTVANRASSAKRNTINLREAAMRMKREFLGLSLGVTSYLRLTDVPQRTALSSGTIQDFPGRSISRIGFDWSGTVGAFYCFGEFTLSHGSKKAFLSGFIKSMGPLTEAILILRSYQYDPATYNRLGIAAGSSVSNESGVLLALSHKLPLGVKFNWLTDVYLRPLSQGLSPGPVYGTEHSCRVMKSWSKLTSAYVMIASKTKTVYDFKDQNPYKTGTPHSTLSYRLNFEHMVYRSVRTRIRIMGAMDKLISRHWSGLCYYDLRFKPTGGKLTCTVRWSVFNIPDYSLRLYTYENDVLYSHSIPAFGKSGSRLYTIFTIPFNRNLRIQVKSGISFYRDPKGLNAVSALPDLKVMVRWSG